MDFKLDDLVCVKIAGADNHEHLSWAEGMLFGIPLPLLRATGLIKCLNENKGVLTLPGDFAPIAPEWAAALRIKAAFTADRPLSSRLPFSYQYVPTVFRDIAASIIGKLKRREMDRRTTFPIWPMDLSADFLADLSRERPSPFTNDRSPVILSHDLDSLEGFDNLIKHFLDIEEEFEARSLNFIVPHSWPIDHDKIELVLSRGHMMGIHGYDHSNCTSFCDEFECNQRLLVSKPLIDKYHMHGYRSPSLLRTPLLLKALSDIFIFDSSIPTSGGIFPVPNNGCASARPFLVEGIIELPLSMPRDGSLSFLGYSDCEILSLWIDCAKSIARSRGVIVLLTHCERRFSGNPKMLAVYRKFLEYIASSEQFFFATPMEIIRDSRRFA